MVPPSDKDGARRAGLLLKVTLQAEGLVTLGQHALIDRPVGLMAGIAALPQRFMLEHKRPALHRMTLETGLVRRPHLGTATTMRGTFVRVVAGSAAHLSFQHRMMMRKPELCLHIQVALETGLRRMLRINDRAPATALFYVNTARTMARFAANLFPIISGQPSVGSGFKITHDFAVTGITRF